MSLMGTRRWPHLASLFGGYLHQDFTAEYGSASRAVQAWLTEARAGAARELSAEWRTFLNVTSGMDPHARARTLREVAGGSWAPRDEREFEFVSALLMDAGRT